MTTTTTNKKTKKIARGNILLIEDDAYVSQAYAYFLKEAGYTVDAAHNVLQARKQLRMHIPDLILLDLIMPGINGFEFLSEIKNNPKTANVPVIVVSNLCQDGDIERCKRIGAADYLIKSNFFMRDVVEKIKKYMPKL
jgi:DNA-binding response OmpR family regulator